MVGRYKALVLLETFQVRQSSVTCANGLKGGFQRREWKGWIWIWKGKTESINAEPSTWNQKKSTGTAVYVVMNRRRSAPKTGSGVGFTAACYHKQVIPVPLALKHKEQRWGKASKVLEVPAVVNAFTWLPKSSNQKMHTIASSFILAIKWGYWGHYGKILQHGRFIWNKAASL